MAANDKPFTAPYFTDYVGRRRKLNASAIKSICSDFAEGATVRDLAESWGVSTSLVRTITYHTRRNTNDRSE